MLGRLVQSIMRSRRGHGALLSGSQIPALPGSLSPIMSQYCLAAAPISQGQPGPGHKYINKNIRLHGLTPGMQRPPSKKEFPTCCS